MYGSESAPRTEQSRREELPGIGDTYLRYMSLCFER